MGNTRKGKIRLESWENYEFIYYLLYKYLSRVYVTLTFCLAVGFPGAPFCSGDCGLIAERRRRSVEWAVPRPRSFAVSLGIVLFLSFAVANERNAIAMSDRSHAHPKRCHFPKGAPNEIAFIFSQQKQINELVMQLPLVCFYST